MTDQEIDSIREQYATCDPTYGRWHTDESKLRAFAREILSRAIPEGHVVVPKEPVAYLFTCRGKRAELVQFASVADNAHWPVDQWESYKVEPLYAAAPANKEG